MLAERPNTVQINMDESNKDLLCIENQLQRQSLGNKTVETASNEELVILNTIARNSNNMNSPASQTIGNRVSINVSDGGTG